MVRGAVLYQLPPEELGLVLAVQEARRAAQHRWLAALHADEIARCIEQRCVDHPQSNGIDDDGDPTERHGGLVFLRIALDVHVGDEPAAAVLEDVARERLPSMFEALRQQQPA